MESSKVYILCLMGLPGSGKTYLSSHLLQYKFNFEKILYFPFDLLIQWDNEELNLKKQRQQIFFLIENKIQLHLQDHIQTDSKENLLILLDDNMYYRSMRYDYFKMAIKYNCYFCIIFLDTPLIECFKNNYNRSDSIPTHIILDMNSKLEPPSLNNNWELNYIKINIKEEIIVDCLMKIKLLLDNCKPCSKIEIPNYKQENELARGKIHLADLALRRLISELMQKSKATKQKAKQLNLKRQEILNIIRKDMLSLPEVECNSPDALDNYIKFLYHQFFQVTV